jgi:DNA-binding XRE family transcriptional regulator
MKRNLLVYFRGKRSQREMGEIYGVSQQSWARWEQAGNYKPNIITMKKLENDIGKPMEKIFFDIFNTKKVLNNKTTA